MEMKRRHTPKTNLFDTKNTLGDTIRALRKRAKMTQEELADGICSPISVSRIENGVQMPSSSILDALLNRLGTSTYQLCNIYYQTDKQLAFEQKASLIEKLIQSGQFEQAETMLEPLKQEIEENTENLQCYLLLTATIALQHKNQPKEALITLRDALALTKPSFDYDDFRNTLLTVCEASLLNHIIAALYETGEILSAIHVGEELIFSLKKHQSSLSEYLLMRINASLNLSQCLALEHRYTEALQYCEEAEYISINSLAHILLPEIEYMKATLYHSLGKNAECEKIIRTIIPYMELIQKNESAQRARDYARTELGLDL